MEAGTNAVLVAEEETNDKDCQVQGYPLLSAAVRDPFEWQDLKQKLSDWKRMLQVGEGSQRVEEWDGRGGKEGVLLIGK